ncbi:MAG TPA: hypothetical protein VK549_08270 [Acidimicrobiia bacterium]|nr:hypothetical protein [Acidimicrobiia bacterium]
MHEHGWRVERTFDGRVRWFRADGSRYRGGPEVPAVVPPDGFVDTG